MSPSGAQAFVIDGRVLISGLCILLKHFFLSTSIGYNGDQGGILPIHLWGLGTQMLLEEGNTEACVDDSSTASIRGSGFWHRW